MRVPVYNRSRIAPATSPVPVVAPRQAPVEGQRRAYEAEGLRAAARAGHETAQAFGVAAQVAGRANQRRAEELRAVDVALGDVASAAEAIGMDIAKSQAVDALTAYSQQVDALLYSPENGFITQRGLNAVSAYESVQERLNTMHDEVLGKLSGPARRFAELDMLNRRDRAVIRAGTHFVGERRSYAIESAEASIAAASREAFFDPTATDAAIATIRGQVSRIGQQEGWSQEKVEIETASRVSSLYAGTVNQLSARSPSAAMQYLEAHRNQIDPQTVASLQKVLLPAMREEAGRQLGALAANGVTQQAQAQFAALQGAWGTTLSVTSSYRSPAKNAAVGGASNSLHMQGKAFDISTRGWSQQEKLEFIRTARANGFGGIGVYSGHIHIDLGDQRFWGPDHRSTSAPGWALEALATPVSAVSITDDVVTLDNLVDLHPEARNAALKEYNLRTTLQAQQEEAQILGMVEASQQIIGQGGDWESELTAAQKVALGPERIEDLREMESSLAEGYRPDPRSPAYATLYDDVMTAAERGDVQTVRLQGWKLTQSDYHSAISTARGDQGQGPSRATVMSSADATLRGMGILKTGKDATPRVYAAAQVQIMEWIGRNPNANQAQLDAAAQRIGTMALAEVTIDPPGPFNRERGSLDEIDVSDMNVDDMVSAAGRGHLVIGKRKVSAEGVEAAMEELKQQLGEDPTSQQLLEFMMARP